MTLIRITRWRLKPSKDGWMDVYSKGRWKFVLKFQDLVLTMTHLMVMIVTIIWSWIWRKLEISLKLWNQRFFLLQNFCMIWIYFQDLKWTLLEIYCRPERRFLAFVIMSLWSLCCIISWIINDLIKHKQYLAPSCVLCAAVYLVATAVYGSSW